MTSRALESFPLPVCKAQANNSKLLLSDSCSFVSAFVSTHSSLHIRLYTFVSSHSSLQDKAQLALSIAD